MVPTIIPSRLRMQDWRAAHHTTPHLDLLPGEVLSCAPEYSLSDLFHLPHHDTFPTLCLPALHPNTDPHANLPPSHLLSLPTVTSSLNTAAWSFHLQDYPDRLFVDTIIHVINHGTNIGYHEDHNHSQACSNLRSSAENPAAVAADIVSQVTAGHTHGPFNATATAILPFFAARCCHLQAPDQNPPYISSFMATRVLH